VKLYSDTMQDWPQHEDHEQVIQKLRNKKKQVAWFVSNCHSYSGREQYVKELQKYINVDIYGECGPLKCANKTHRNDCLPMLATDYKFYLALENSLCLDYVTEKFYSALTSLVIPIVNGPVDYSQFAPEGSFIHIRHFESAKHLAQHLNYLDSNQTAFEQYFEWRRFYVPKRTSGWCQLCGMLNNASLPNQFQRDVSAWWFRSGVCGGNQTMITSRPDISFIWQNRSTEVT
jgi:Glycosyltransferase family 10 (fucosyltransferase) C-term